MFFSEQKLFESRREAGQKLARLLTDLQGRTPVVLGVPRGGVPVAAQVADHLRGELDVIVVKKLGAPDNPELAVGAVGESGEPYLNLDVVASLGVDQEYLTEAAGDKHEEVKDLLSVFREVKDKCSLEDRTVILVDDGIATGATISACLEIIHREDPERLVLAVPVAPAETIRRLRENSPADRVECLHEIEGFFGGIGGYYRDFAQVSTDEVREMLTFRDGG